MFWQTIRRLRGKRSHTARSIKDQNGVLLGNGKAILRRWREYFKDILNPVIITSPNIRKVHPREENSQNTITAADVSLAVKPLKAAGCVVMKFDLKCSKPLESRSYLAYSCVDWQTGVVIPIHKKGDRSECTNYRSISLLSLSWKLPWKRCSEIIEPKLDDIHCGFVPATALQT